jgi:hypothetical protein
VGDCNIRTGANVNIGDVIITKDSLGSGQQLIYSVLYLFEEIGERITNAEELCLGNPGEGSS